MPSLALPWYSASSVIFDYPNPCLSELPKTRSIIKFTTNSFSIRIISVMCDHIWERQQVSENNNYLHTRGNSCSSQYDTNQQKRMLLKRRSIRLVSNLDSRIFT